MRKTLTGALILTPIVFIALAFAMLSGPRASCGVGYAPDKLGTLCGFANPADIEYAAGAGVVLVSERRRELGGDGGGISALIVGSNGPTQPWRIWPTGNRRSDHGPVRGLRLLGDPQCTEPPAPHTFSPHGIAARTGIVKGVVRVAVVGHGAREAVEIFDVYGSGRQSRMTWRGCVPLEKNRAADDVVIVGPQEFIVASDVAIARGAEGVFYRIAKRFGSSQGHLAHWRPGKGWRVLEGTVGPTINGLVLSQHGHSVLYSESSTGELKRMGWKRRARKHPRERLRIGGRPDNLNMAPDGKVLLITHLNGAASNLCKFGNLPCRSDWSLLEIDPTRMKATRLLVHNGSSLGEATSVIQVRDYYLFAAAYDDRIGVWRPGPGAAKARAEAQQRKAQAKAPERGKADPRMYNARGGG